MSVLPRSPMLRHVLAVGVAIWGMSALVKYRVVGWSVVAYLPMVGSTILVLNVVLIVNRIVPVWSKDGTLHDMMTRLDFGARLLIVLFAYWALFVTFNAGLDHTPRLLHHAAIEDIGGRTVTAGVPLVYSWARVRWQTSDGDRLDTFVLGPEEQRKFWRGELALLAVGRGRLGLRWITAFERDEEAYTRKVFELSPNAPEPWEALVKFFFDHGPWEQAAAESRRYMEAHPDAADFAYWAGENLSLRGLEHDAVPLLERAVALRPSRYRCYRLAWLHTRRGDASRALEVLTDASTRYPNAWEFPFLLGYNHAKLGRYAEARADLEQVESLHPGVPDVASTIARLRAKIAGR